MAHRDNKNNVIEGLRVALEIARHQLAYHRKASQAEGNPDRYEDGCCAWSAQRIVTKIEAALSEAKRQRERAA